MQQCLYHSMQDYHSKMRELYVPRRPAVMSVHGALIPFSVDRNQLENACPHTLILTDSHSHSEAGFDAQLFRSKHRCMERSTKKGYETLVSQEHHGSRGLPPATACMCVLLPFMCNWSLLSHMVVPSLFYCVVSTKSLNS